MLIEESAQLPYKLRKYHFTNIMIDDEIMNNN